MITYSNPSQGDIVVMLDRKIVGFIKKVEDGYQYFIKGRSTSTAEVFSTIRQVKQSLEEEQ